MRNRIQCLARSKRQLLELKDVQEKSYYIDHVMYSKDPQFGVPFLEHLLLT
jgi:hypothetical protein